MNVIVDHPLDAAFRRIATWMRARGADILVDNLAPPATTEQLAACERALGFALPAGVRDLWSVHAGQRSEQNGFVGFMDLLGPHTVRDGLESMQLFLDELRDAPDEWSESGVTREEMESRDWVPIAARGYADALVVAPSGRVFWCGKNAPPLRLVAPSVGAWLDAYANRVEAGELTVEPGFGTWYLAGRAF